MILKSVFFPCNCRVEGPEASAVVDTNTWKDLLPEGMVTMIDLGADSCVPCKMMAPIIDELQKTYEGQAAILFVDVYQDKEQAKAFGIRAIPTQIFFDKNGREVYRHAGFMSKAAIVEQLKKMGVG
ncbi:MAG: thioredoxin family protein [Deltaproteobacteria bacterium]|nr:thioredoxin family protein [Deltaproteobacteria bacterium]